MYYSLFDLLCSYFIKGGTGDGMIELDMVEKKHRYDARLMLVEEHLDYYDLLDYFAGTRYTGDFEEISGTANRIFTKILSEHKDSNCGGFLKTENYQIMVPQSLSAAEATIAYYSLLVAIRKKYRIGLPLIVEGLGRRGLKYAPLLAQTAAEAAPQVVILMTSRNFERPMFNYRTRKKTRSLYDEVRKSTLGSVCVLDRTGAKDYDPVTVS